MWTYTLMFAICSSTFTFSFVLWGGGSLVDWVTFSPSGESCLVWRPETRWVSELISLNFNKRVRVVRHCHDEDHKTCQEFTLAGLIIMNAATWKEFQLSNGCVCRRLWNIPAVRHLQHHQELGGGVISTTTVCYYGSEVDQKKNISRPQCVISPKEPISNNPADDRKKGNFNLGRVAIKRRVCQPQRQSWKLLVLCFILGRNKQING